ncbi:MAG: RagB/SusD family nutrient uptake outer membrane protein [Muribaculaceae bacterium]
MKSYINKIFSIACAILIMSMSSCIGDLDLLPNDPTQLTPDKFKEHPKEYLMQVMAKCYSSLAVSGQSGPDGDSDISGLDGGSSQYTRAIFMLNEFTTDESKWIWPDEGVLDIVTNTWGTGNANVFGAYSRFYVHIAICNDFLRLIEPGNLKTLEIPVDAELQKSIDQYRIEARALRALSYYNAIDIFGNVGFIDEKSGSGIKPVQKTREELYNWLVTELSALVDVMPEGQPFYGRVGKDGVEALLAKTYLNAKVYTDGKVDGYALCAERCQNIINRHKGGGFDGSGLAQNYMYLFCGSNNVYMPGGGNTDENEILWGIPYDSDMIQPYGGTTFLCAANVKNMNWKDNNAIMTSTDYGMQVQWGCMHATAQFSDKFESENDVRWSMWCKEKQGFKKTNDGFSEFTDGYGVVKFTNLIAGTDGAWSPENGGIYDPSGEIPARSESFPDTDLPLIRLADIYLMYAEANIVGHAGSANDALTYVNYVRKRAKAAAWNATDMTADNILDERCRELYWENVRRTDLVRFNKFTGTTYLWNWKGNVMHGTSIAAHRNLFPIPANVIAAQPEFKQNPGY